MNSTRTRKHEALHSTLERFSTFVAKEAGSSWAFIIALGLILTWASSGFLFRFSGEWQMLLQTALAVLTFLMVFLIQRAQNKEMQAVQLKLDELIASVDGASNRLIKVENATEDELNQVHDIYTTIAAQALARDASPSEVHSIEEHSPSIVPIKV